MHKIIVPKFTSENGFSTTPSRSGLMRKIRSTQTKPEQLLRKELWARGFRYRINYSKLPGKPDIVIATKKLVIFIDGEFWHGYKWEEKKPKIKANRNYWIPKIERNMQRDRENEQTLKQMGYTVIRFWEHELKKEFDVCVAKVLQVMNR